MPVRGTGIFKGFDLEDASSLRELALWLIQWLQGVQTPKYDPVNTSTSVQVRRGTIDRITRLMKQSPLINEIVNHFLEIYENSPRRSIILAAGQLLAQYAISQAENPRTYDYARASEAWRTRTPIGPPASVLPDHIINVAKIMKDIKKQEKRRVSWDPSESEDEAEQATQAKIDSYNRKAMEMVQDSIIKARVDENEQDYFEIKKRNAEDEEMENARSQKRQREFGVKNNYTPPKLMPIQRERISCRDDAPSSESTPPPNQPKSRSANGTKKKSRRFQKGRSLADDDNGLINFPGLLKQ